MTGPVTVVVIAYNDVTRLRDAVTSALAQGEAVGEVVVVDDASSDGTGAEADRLAAVNRRVRVVHHEVNSGGCGTPRNTGAAAARGEWISFLDSDDELPPGAVDALLSAARRHRADVAAGLCVRLEMPERRRLPWQPDLFLAESVHDGLSERPQTVHDTLSVNKLYRRRFLDVHDVRFPDGAAHYEDFVFTGRLYAAAPRFAVIPDPVYLWYARPSAANPSISLRRDRIGNWHDRLAAHRGAVDALRAGGEKGLALAAQVKFLAHDLPMYLRDLRLRTPQYREEWWRSTQEYIGSFAPEAFDTAAPADRWRAEAVLGRARGERAGLRRMAELSAVPPRLAPPYAGGDLAPEWDGQTPPVPLDGLRDAALTDLPLCVTADVRAGRRIVLRLELAEMYGRLAAEGPEHVEVELRHRVHGWVLRQRAPWSPVETGWRASVCFDAVALRRSAAMAAWDAWATLSFRSGPRMDVRVRAGGGLGRTVVPAAGSVLLLQPYATADSSLAVRVADGASGMRRVMRGRFTGRRRG